MSDLHDDLARLAGRAPEGDAGNVFHRALSEATAQRATPPPPRRLAPALVGVGAALLFGALMFWSARTPAEEPVVTNPPASTTSTTQAATTTTTVLEELDRYGANGQFRWKLPAVDGKGDIDSTQLGIVAVVKVELGCDDCRASVEAVHTAAMDVGITDVVVIVTGSELSDEEMLAEVRSWDIPETVRVARDVFRDGEWATDDILRGPVPLLGLWRYGGWRLFTAAPTDPALVAERLGTSGILDEPTPPEPAWIGDGWEVYDLPWKEPRYRMASAWMNGDLYLWGGVGTQFHEPAPSVQEGWVWTRSGQWEMMPEGPLCPLIEPRAVAAGSEIYFWSSSGASGDCARAAAFDTSTETWREVEGELFRRAGRASPVVWTGTALVAPTVGWSYVPSLGEEAEVPETPATSSSSTPVTAHWDEQRVWTLGATSLFSWEPGDEQWTFHDTPPVGSIARSSVFGEDRIVAVDYQMEAAAFDLVDPQWGELDSLPLRFYECVPLAGRVDDLIAVRTCSGWGVYDDVRGGWMVYPLSGDDTGTVVFGDEAIYEIGTTLRRLEISRFADGRLGPEQSIPVGVFQLEIGRDWDVVSTLGARHDHSGSGPPREFHSFELERNDGERCYVGASYGMIYEVVDGVTYPTIVSDRTGSEYSAMAVPPGGWDDSPHLVVASSNGSDHIDFACSSMTVAEELARRLWSPWE